MKRISLILMILLSIVLVSCDKTVNFDVQFYNNIENQEVSETINVEKDSLLEEPKELTNGDLVLTGWFTDLNDSESQWDFKVNKVNKDLSLYAKWSSNYNVNFYNNIENEELSSDISVLENSLISSPEGLQNGSKVLVGWYTNIEDLSTKWDFETKKVTADTSLYALWAEVSNTIAAYDGSSGTINMRDDENNAYHLGLDTDIFTVDTVRSSNNVGLNKAGYMRIYRPSPQGNNILRVSIHESFIITDVEIFFGSEKGSAKITLGTEEIELESPSSSISYNNLAISLFEITNTMSSGARTDISSIKISYVQLGEGPIREEDINRPVITQSKADTLYEMVINEDFVAPVLTATDVEDGIVDVHVDQSTYPDNTTPGWYYVKYSATDSDGNTSKAYITVIVRETKVLDSDYYAGTADLTGQELKDYLNEILNTGFNLQTYNVARQALEIADRDPYKFENVLLIYDRDSDKGEWDHPIWEREHVWPQSMLPEQANASTANVASDLHNLRAIRPHVNQNRSNYYFVDPVNPDDEFGIVGTDTYYPGDDCRGDVARIMLYMNVAWNLPLREDINTLARWHFADPVDEFEIIRNEVIYDYQGNRNPFIDNPEFVRKIYGDGTVINNNNLSFNSMMPVTSFVSITNSAQLVA